MSTGDPMIEATGITRTFGSVDALSSVSLSVERGTVLGLLGHNGAGKTTLVNILTTMLPASSGTARVAGFDVAREGGEVRSRIGLTGQFASAGLAPPRGELVGDREHRAFGIGDHHGVARSRCASDRAPHAVGPQ
ncbi:ATP-binding cassette domain-containing protein [Amycolatopsis sp. DSM 110486]|uniref:ATP-binding cassette domain-containing protein n=1 Tax=Amycolatopsis sp. DSM 110486 TaxID=2865832 RepID=UPI001C6A1DF4|nr:ATP-binding cassette domain-containing protein [Amycolatopsis sp. DSM 110486]